MKPEKVVHSHGLATARSAGPDDAAIIADLRRQIAALTRENRVLKIACGELERVSERDTLTPLYNRRYFLSALHQRIARRQRYGETMALIFVDVDGLKAINDRHGHGVGDFALMEIARRLSAGIRTTDLAARIGGDEFGVILDHIDEPTARRKAATLMADFAAHPAEYNGLTFPLTASFGVAMLDPAMDEAAIIAAADRDMYAAKSGHRATPDAQPAVPWTR